MRPEPWDFEYRTAIQAHEILTRNMCRQILEALQLAVLFLAKTPMTADHVVVHL